MKVEDGMSELVLMIGPAHTLREAARMMAARRVGAAVVVDPEHAGVGILTERDILNSIAADKDPDTELAAQHCTQDLVFAARAWTLEDAAAAMVRGGFRHLVVVEGHEVVGLLSMRDIVRCWSAAMVPAQASPPSISPAVLSRGIPPDPRPLRFPPYHHAPGRAQGPSRGTRSRRASPRANPP